MHPYTIDIGAYLERIGLASPGPPNAEGLWNLQRGQLTHVPFENFDVHLGRDISLRPTDLFDKLVSRRRGGYCFELNGMLAYVLESLGYRPRSHLARVIFGRGSSGARTHQVLIVQAEERDWLVDVGFGGPGLRAPLPLEVEREEMQDGERFRLRRDDQFGYVLQKNIAEQWVDLYAFELQPALPLDFEMANFFVSRHPQSYFRLNRVAALQRARGRLTLLNFTLSVADDGVTTSRTLPAGEGYLSALTEYFGIELSQCYDDLLPIGV